MHLIKPSKSQSKALQKLNNNWQSQSDLKIPTKTLIALTKKGLAEMSDNPVLSFKLKHEWFLK